MRRCCAWRSTTSYLALEDAAGQIVGVVARNDLLRPPRYAPLVLLRDIAAARTPEEVARHCEANLSIAANLLDASARPRYVNSTLATVFDAASARLIRLAVAASRNWLLRHSRSSRLAARAVTRSICCPTRTTGSCMR